MKRNYQGDIQQFNLDPDVQRCSSLYDAKSFPDLLSVTRREMSHSAFISELLKYESFHGLGNYPLLLFLQAVLHRADQQGTKIQEGRNKGKPVFFTGLRSAILSQSLNPSGISVQKEWSFKDKGDNSGRVDILVRCKVNVDREGGRPVQALNVIIENKVFASEQNEQTEKYYLHFNALLNNNSVKTVGKKTAKQEAGGPRSRYNLYVYLTPLEVKEMIEPECKCKECVQISYQDLVDGVIEPMLNHPSLSPRGRFILEEYLRSLSVSFEAVEESSPVSRGRVKAKKAVRQVILAVGKKEKEQLFELWKKYNPLLKAAINEVNNDSDEENDGSAGRVYYAYKGQTYSMGRLVEAIVSDKLGHYTFDEMNTLFRPVGINNILSKEKKANNYFPECAPSTKDTDPITPYIFKTWTQDKNFKKFTEFVKKEWDIDIEPIKEERLSLDDRVCLRDFYGMHDNLITTMLEVIKRFHDEEKDREEADSLLKRCTRRRDRTTYNIALGGSTLGGLSWGRMVLTVIQDYASQGMSLDEVKNAFGLPKNSIKKWDGKIEGKTGYFIEDGERVELDGKPYVIKQGWSKGLVEEFIDNANDLGYEISEEQ